MKLQFSLIVRVFTAVICLSIAAVFVEFMLLRGSTPAIHTPDGLAVLEKQRIGGADQYVLIRGQDTTKPVLLFLHGGPGMPAMFLAHAFQRELERDFTVVHWDRRGAGKSYAAGLQSPNLSISQTLEDTFELTRHLQSRFNQRRIYLIGHSSGSYLGLLAVREHPEYYAAFIGTGQLAGTHEEVRALRREFLLQMAKKNGDQRLIDKLADATVAASEDDLFYYGGELHAAESFWPLLLTGLRAPEYTLSDALNVKKGADFVNRKMQYDVSPVPLSGDITGIQVPVFFFLGRYDFNTPSQLAANYLKRLDAPLKGLIWFEQSAHFPFYEEPDLFRQGLIRIEQDAGRYWREQAIIADTDSKI